jgi:hypothetical protein
MYSFGSFSHDILQELREDVRVRQRIDLEMEQTVDELRRPHITAQRYPGPKGRLCNENTRLSSRSILMLYRLLLFLS